MFQNSFEVHSSIEPIISKIEKEMAGLQVIDMIDWTLPCFVYDIRFDVSGSRKFQLIEEFILKIVNAENLKQKATNESISNMLRLDDVFIDKYIDELLALGVIEKTEESYIKITKLGREYYEKGVVPRPPITREIKVIFNPYLKKIEPFQNYIVDQQIINHYLNLNESKQSKNDYYLDAKLFEKPEIIGDYLHLIELQPSKIDSVINTELIEELLKETGQRVRGELGEVITKIHSPSKSGDTKMLFSEIWIQDMVDEKFFPRIFNYQKKHFEQEIANVIKDKELMPKKISLFEENTHIPVVESDKIQKIYQPVVKDNAEKIRKDDKQEHIDIRLVRGSNIRHEFYSALKKAKKKIVIISPWITEEAVDKSMKHIFREFVKEGGLVILGWGIGTHEKKEDRPPSENLIKSLKKIKSPDGIPGVIVQWLGNHHNKEVIIDDAIHLAGSFNWLSYRGDYKPRGEQTYIVKDRALAKAAGKEIESLFIKKLQKLVKTKDLSVDNHKRIVNALFRLLSKEKFELIIEIQNKSEHFKNILKILTINKCFDDIYFVTASRYFGLEKDLTELYVMISFLKKRYKNIFKQLIKNENCFSILVKKGIIEKSGDISNLKTIIAKLNFDKIKNPQWL